MQIMFLDIFLDVGSLLALPVSKTSLSAKITRFPPPTSKIYSGIKKIRALLDYVGELSDKSLLSFTVNDCRSTTRTTLSVTRLKPTRS